MADVSADMAPITARALQSAIISAITTVTISAERMVTLLSEYSALPPARTCIRVFSSVSKPSLIASGDDPETAVAILGSTRT